MLLSRRMAVARQLLSPLGAALALSAAVLFFGGGSGSGSIPWIGGAAVAVAVALAATSEAPQRLVALLPLGALAVWCAASIAWSIEPDRSWEYANRPPSTSPSRSSAPTSPDGRASSRSASPRCSARSACGRSPAKVSPALYEDYGRIARLRAPVGYWNALALLGDIALPLGLWLAGRAANGTLLVYGWVVAIALTYSRGGRRRRDRRRRGVDRALGRLDRRNDHARRRGRPGGARDRGTALSLHGVTSDAQSHTTRVRDGLVFGAALVVGARDRGGARPLPRPSRRALARAAPSPP